MWVTFPACSAPCGRATSAAPPSVNVCPRPRLLSSMTLRRGENSISRFVLTRDLRNRCGRKASPPERAACRSSARQRGAAGKRGRRAVGARGILVSDRVPNLMWFSSVTVSCGGGGLSARTLHPYRRTDMAGQTDIQPQLHVAHTASFNLSPPPPHHDVHPSSLIHRLQCAPGNLFMKMASLARRSLARGVFWRPAGPRAAGARGCAWLPVAPMAVRCMRDF